MKEKEWDDFTSEEQKRITKEYEHLNVLISAIRQGILIMYRLDPRGARLVIDIMNEACASLEERTKLEE